VKVNATLGADDPAEAARQAATAVAAGFRTLKVKVGGPRAADRARLVAVRQEVGPEVALRADANGAWCWREAEARIRELLPLGLEYLEQPLPVGTTPSEQADGLATMACLRRLGMPLAVDELLCIDGAAEAAVAASGGPCPSPADVFVLKPQLLGGLRRSIEIARLARGAGIDVVVTSALDGVVGRMGALHLAVALGVRRACGLATGDLLTSDFADGPVARGGRMRPPTEPGLGVAPSPYGGLFPPLFNTTISHRRIFPGAHRRDRPAG
jgi:L-alanine-DL-glutamate epimerase-like enolase superfamily enzyme